MIRTSSNPRPWVSRVCALAIAACLLGYIPPVSGGQEPAPGTQQAIQSTTELVKIDVSVLNQSGSFVGGLGRADFRVLDNGAEAPITFFAPVEAPAQILVMVEASPAVYLIHTEHLLAAYALLNGLSAQDEVALVTYNESPRLVLPFTTNKAALVGALSDVQYTLGTGQLNFYDSVSTILDWVSSRPGKIAIVLLTTGLDSSTPMRWSALAEKARMKDAVIYTVALGGSLRDAGKPPAKTKKSRKAKPEDSPPEFDIRDAFANADHALKTLAQITGGRAYFPQSEKDFAPIYAEIAAGLRHQYVLGITPRHDGEFHPIAVQLLGSDGQPLVMNAKTPQYQIFARQGYLAPVH